MIKVIEGNATVSGDYDTVLAELFTLILELRNVNVRTVDVFNVFVSGMVTKLSAYCPDVTPEDYLKEEERLLTMSPEDRMDALSKMMKAERNMQ